MASTVASQSLHQYIIGQLRRNLLLLTSYFLLLTSLLSCGSSKFISKQAKQNILSDSNLTTAHLGISIYDASTNKYLYNYQGDKYFIPASNTKLFTCYAAMKHLGDSLVGLKYVQLENDSSIIAEATGDPTLLHASFKKQPVYSFFAAKKEWNITVLDTNWNEQPLGYGWAWDDYESTDASERSSFPVYGNIATLRLLPLSQREKIVSNQRRYSLDLPEYKYRVYKTVPNLLDSLVNDAFYDKLSFLENENLHGRIERKLGANSFSYIKDKSSLPKKIEVPFATKEINPWQILEDSAKSQFLFGYMKKVYGKWQTVHLIGKEYRIDDLNKLNWKKIYTQPTDSVLKPMMHRSDNFFAEQTLLMVSNEMTGVMNDEKIIDSLLKTDFKDFPQKPRWVDGSGLSRYNLFSPQDFVTVLNKMKNDFSWNRITTILATGGEGTLTNYYLDLKNRIYAKTGTLSNNVALSGFLISKKNKTIIFSVLVNNHMGNTTQIRKAVEKFLTSIAEKY